MSKITKETGKTLASEIIKDLEKEARNKDLAIIALPVSYTHLRRA